MCVFDEGTDRRIGSARRPRTRSQKGKKEKSVGEAQGGIRMKCADLGAYQHVVNYFVFSFFPSFIAKNLQMCYK